jgi:hypothetical protein
MKTNNELDKYFKPKLNDYFYGLYRSFVILAIYLIELRFRKFLYIFFSLFKFKNIIRLKVCIEMAKRQFPHTKISNIKVKDLKFGHPVDFKYDFELQRRTRELGKCQNLDMNSFNEICHTNYPILTWNNILLDGNGRLKALIDAGHTEFVITVNERVKNKD